MVQIKFTKKEAGALLVSALVLGFIFSFKKWGAEEVDIGLGVANFALYSLIAALTVFANILIKKIVAQKKQIEATYHLWSIQRYGFRTTATLPKKIKLLGVQLRSLTMGILVPLFVSFISNGGINFAMVGSFRTGTPFERVTKKYSRITDYEIALIATSGILMNTALALIAKSLTVVDPVFEAVFLVNLTFIFFNLLPLPHFDGIKIFFGSVALFVLLWLFVVTSMFLASYFNIIYTLLISLIVTLVFFFIHSYLFELK